VDNTWDSLTVDYENFYDSMLKPMIRRELSFHENVKLLGYLCAETYYLPGDILEIGVWKGKSLALMDRLSPRSIQLIGIDPCEISGQLEELTGFLNGLIPRASVIVDYSERGAKDVLSISQNFKLIHIDGGHLEHHVWTDFLIYSNFVVPGGYIVFDDYLDEKHSPEVKIAIDHMLRLGIFKDFEILGLCKKFNSSFVVKRK